MTPCDESAVIFIISDFISLHGKTLGLGLLEDNTLLSEILILFTEIEHGKSMSFNILDAIESTFDKDISKPILNKPSLRLTISGAKSFFLASAGILTPTISVPLGAFLNLIDISLLIAFISMELLSLYKLFSRATYVLYSHNI